MNMTHEHRRPMKRDFEGKTIYRFVRTADNVWQVYFTDGTAFAIQSELHYGLAVMEVCEVCAEKRPIQAKRVSEGF